MRRKFFREKLIFGIILLFVSQIFLPPLAAQTMDMQELKGTRIITKDNTPPQISDVNYPWVVTVPSTIIISAIVTDDVAVGTVKLIIEFPSCTLNLTMTNTPSTNIYSFDPTLFLKGEYKFWIWASDTSGNTKSSSIYTIDGQLSSSAPDVGYFGEVTLIWDWWNNILPGVGFSKFYTCHNISIDLNCTNGKAVIQNLSFGYRIQFYLGPYSLPRISHFQLACFYDKECTQPILGAYDYWTLSAYGGKNDNHFANTGMLKNVSIDCQGLDNRTIYCKVTIAPRLMFMFLRWLDAESYNVCEIFVKFNYP